MHMRMKFSDLDSLVITVEPQKRKKARAPELSSSVEDFITASVIVKPGSETSKDDLYAAYSRFCAEHGRKVDARQFFFKQLKRKLPYEEERRSEGYQRHRYVIGLSLDEAD